MGIRKQRIENSALVINTAWEELKRVRSQLDDLRRDSVTREEVRRLILDAIHKAEDLRDRKRVKRIGKILAHALTLSSSDFDKGRGVDARCEGFERRGRARTTTPLRDAI